MPRAKLIMMLTVLLMTMPSCSQRPTTYRNRPEGNAYAELFSIGQSPDGHHILISISPFDGSSDTLNVDAPLQRIICMSGTSVAAIDAVGEAGRICGISGVRYISSPSIREMHVAEVGYDEMPDYERIVALHPDLLLAFQTGPFIPAYVDKLRSLGIRVMFVYDHMENHPLARAEYIRFHASLVGKTAQADSLFREICDSYAATATAARGLSRKKVLMNTPYADQWFIPGRDSYMARLIEDAGGTVLGAEDGRESSVIGIEKALSLAEKADFWLHPGQAGSLAELKGLHPLFPHFPVIDRENAVWNNDLRTTPEGGNDFWEGGAMRPDLILQDLVKIFHGTASPENYYRPLR